MAQGYRNWKDLEKKLETRIQFALKQTQNEVMKCLQESINEYYKEKVFKGKTSSIPAVYQRTYELLNSAIKTEIVKHRNMYYCEVKIDEDYLHHQYIGGATGLQVITWNEENGSHGGVVAGEHKIWTEMLQNLKLQGGILTIFKIKLRQRHIKVR